MENVGKLRSRFRELVYQYQASNPDKRMTFDRISELIGVPAWFVSQLWHDKVIRLNLEQAARVCSFFAVDLGALYVLDGFEVTGPDDEADQVGEEAR